METQTFPSDLSDEDLDALDGTSDAGDPAGGAEDDASSITQRLINDGMDPERARQYGSRFVPKADYQRAKDDAKRTQQEYQQLQATAQALYNEVQSRNGGMTAAGSTKDDDFEAVRQALLERGQDGAALVRLLDLHRADVERRVDAKYAGAAQQTHQMRVDSYLKERKQSLRAELGKGLDKIWNDVEKLSRQRQTDPEEILRTEFRDDYRRLVANSVATETRKQREAQRDRTMEGGAGLRGTPPLTGGGLGRVQQPDAKKRPQTITEIANEVLRDVLR